MGAVNNLFGITESPEQRAEKLERIRTFCENHLHINNPVLEDNVFYDPHCKASLNNCHHNVRLLKTKTWRPQLCWKINPHPDNENEFQAILHTVLRHKKNNDLRDITPGNDGNIIIRETRANNNQVLQKLESFCKKHNVRSCAFDSVYNCANNETPMISFFDAFC